MSRTDVHRPGWVQERDPLQRHEWRIQHNHWHHDHWDPELQRYLVRLSVPCDLQVHLASKTWVWTRCRPHYSGHRRLCGCSGCAGQDARKRMRRQERTRWRSLRQQALAEHRAGHHDIDIPPIRGEAWR